MAAPFPIVIGRRHRNISKSKSNSRNLAPDKPSDCLCGRFSLSLKNRARQFLKGFRAGLNNITNEAQSTQSLRYQPVRFWRSKITRINVSWCRDQILRNRINKIEKSSTSIPRPSLYNKIAASYEGCTPHSKRALNSSETQSIGLRGTSSGRSASLSPTSSRDKL
jgi:hypothetical protein